MRNLTFEQQRREKKQIQSKSVPVTSQLNHLLACIESKENFLCYLEKFLTIIERYCFICHLSVARKKRLLVVVAEVLSQPCAFQVLSIKMPQPLLDLRKNIEENNLFSLEVNKF